MACLITHLVVSVDGVLGPGEESFIQLLAKNLPTNVSNFISSSLIWLWSSVPWSEILTQMEKWDRI